jgi:hypothetical protein
VRRAASSNAIITPLQSPLTLHSFIDDRRASCASNMAPMKGSENKASLEGKVVVITGKKHIGD